MGKHKIALMLTAGALFLTMSASAVTFGTGDIFASIGSGQVQVYDPTGAPIALLNTGLGGFTTGSVSNTTTGNFYVTDFSAQNVSAFDNHGTLLGTFGSGYNADPESILFDGSGNVYVGQADGTHHVLEFNSSGGLINTFAPTTDARGTDWIELASDQHTLYYASEGLDVQRFDTATNTQLTDFNTAPLPGTNAFALRILGDGGVLVADSQEVVRLDAAGNVVQTYSPSGGAGELFSLNLDPDGTSFWTGNDSTGVLYKINIASGAIEQTINTCGADCLFGVSVYGEITEAQTPEPGQLGTSLALIGLLAFLGYRRSKLNTKAVEKV